MLILIMGMVIIQYILAFKLTETETQSYVIRFTINITILGFILLFCREIQGLDFVSLSTIPLAMYIWIRTSSNYLRRNYKTARIQKPNTLKEISQFLLITSFCVSYIGAVAYFSEARDTGITMMTIGAPVLIASIIFKIILKILKVGDKKVILKDDEKPVTALNTSMPEIPGNRMSAIKCSNCGSKIREEKLVFDDDRITAKCGLCKTENIFR